MIAGGGDDGRGVSDWVATVAVAPKFTVLVIIILCSWFGPIGGRVECRSCSVCGVA